MLLQTSNWPSLLEPPWRKGLYWHFPSLYLQAPERCVPSYVDLSADQGRDHAVVACVNPPAPLASYVCAFLIVQRCLLSRSHHAHRVSHYCVLFVDSPAEAQAAKQGGDCTSLECLGKLDVGGVAEWLRSVDASRDAVTGR